jgi:hypothetical protein
MLQQERELTVEASLSGPSNWTPTVSVLAEIKAERQRQAEKWGEQNFPDGTNTSQADRRFADEARQICKLHALYDKVTWRDILSEEVLEAFAEDDPRKLRAELIQVAAVAVQWVEAIDRRQT